MAKSQVVAHPSALSLVSTKQKQARSFWPRLAKFGKPFLMGLLLAYCLFTSSVQTAEASFFDLFRPGAVQDKTDDMAKAVIAGEQNKPSREDNTNGVLTEGMTSVIMHALGESAVSESTLESMSPEERQIIAQEYGNGAVGSLNEFIAVLYKPPASSRTYLADLLNDMQVVPKAQAQGIGFVSLDPILDSWKIFRNIAYMFFIVIFIIIGFMIMFRHRISGQTVITAQQAIPQVIISLIFVTFSYAIAGLMIDAMNVLMFLLIGLFGADTEYLSYNFLDLGRKLIVGGGFTAGSSMNDSIQQIVNAASLGKIVVWASSITLGVIFACAVLFVVFRLFLKLLETYVTIIISITFAPIILMFGAIPGQKVFKGWITSLAGNLLVFPTVLLILLMCKMMNNGIATGGGFMPPYLLTQGVGVGNAMTALIGLGLLLVIPEIIDKLKKLTHADQSVFAAFIEPARTAFKRGWTGGELIPGLDWTDTSKGIFNPRAVVSGAASFGAIGVGAAVPAGLSAAGAYAEQKLTGNADAQPWLAAKETFGKTARWIGTRTGNKYINSSGKTEEKGGKPK